MQKIILIGRFGKPFGIKGWIKVHSFTYPPENIFLYQRWYIPSKDSWDEIEISERKIQGQTYIVKLKTSDSPEEAKKYTHKDIGIFRSQLPELEMGEFYWTDLEGMKVINAQGKELGQVAYFIETGANDVMVVQGDKEYLIPYISSVIISVNQEQSVIIVDWSEDF